MAFSMGVRSSRWWVRLLWTPHSPAGDIGFIEDFALAKDRNAALKQLIPGTEDYYYFHCLHYLNTGQFDKAAQLGKPLAPAARTRPPRLTEIQTRHALLTYEKDPQGDARLRPARTSGCASTTRRSGRGRADLPTLLDAKLIARDALRAARSRGATSTTLRTARSSGSRPRTCRGRTGANSSRASRGPMCRTCRSL